MPRKGRSAAKDVHDNSSVSVENVTAPVATPALPKGKKRTLDTTETLDPTLHVAQASNPKPPTKRLRKGAELARTEKTSGKKSVRGRLDPIDINQGVEQRNSTSSLNLNSPHDSAPRNSAPRNSAPRNSGPRNSGPDIHGHSDADSDNSDSSDVEVEEAWDDGPHDAQPVVRATSTRTTSKMSALVLNERPTCRGQVQIPGNMHSPVSPGETVTDNIDSPPLGNSHATGTTLATASDPIWPAESNLVHVPGSPMTLSQQSLLVKVICRDSIEHLRKELLFRCAFARPEDVPAMLRKCLGNAMRECTVRGGHYNAAAACVHQRFLTDVDYEAKLARLLRARIPIFRGEVKERCAQLVQVMFLPMQSPAAVAELAEKQLDGYYYTYPISNAARANGIPWRSKPYRNDRIITVLHDVFFSGGTSSYARRFDALFPRTDGPDGVRVRRMPEPMLGLVATGLYAAIHEWRSGVHKSTDFSANTFKDVYDGHILTLKRLKEERPQGFYMMMAELYRLASVDMAAPSTYPINTDIDLDHLGE